MNEDVIENKMDKLFDELALPLAFRTASKIFKIYDVHCFFLNNKKVEKIINNFETRKIGPYRFFVRIEKLAKEYI